MIASKQAILELVNTIPLLSMEDLAGIFGIQENTLNSKFSRWGLIKNKELYKIQIFYKDKTKTCFFNKNKKNLIINRQIHARLTAIAYARLYKAVNEIDNLDVYFEDTETSLFDVENNDYQVDLLLKIKNRITDKRIFLLVEVETGSRSPSESMKKIRKIIETQTQIDEKKEEDKIITIIFQDSAVKNSQSYTESILRKYLDENSIFNKNVYFHSFEFEDKLDLIQIKNNKEVRKINFENIINKQESKGFFDKF